VRFEMSVYNAQRGNIKWCVSDVCLSDDVCLSVCRVHHEYTRRPQPLEARRAGRRRRKACMGWSWAAACGVQGRGILCDLAHSLLLCLLTHRAEALSAAFVWRLSVWRLSRTSGVTREQRGLGRLKLTQR